MLFKSCLHPLKRQLMYSRVFCDQMITVDDKILLNFTKHAKLNTNYADRIRCTHKCMQIIVFKAFFQVYYPFIRLDVLMLNVNAYALEKIMWQQKRDSSCLTKEKRMFCQREGPLRPQDTVCHNPPHPSTKSIPRHKKNKQLKKIINRRHLQTVTYHKMHVKY